MTPDVQQQLADIRALCTGTAPHRAPRPAEVELLFAVIDELMAEVRLTDAVLLAEYRAGGA